MVLRNISDWLGLLMFLFKAEFRICVSRSRASRPLLSAS